jgi:hypothetical protein
MAPSPTPDDASLAGTVHDGQRMTVGFASAFTAYLQSGTAAVLALRALEPLRCCLEGYQSGPAACTCWRPIYDQDQAEHDAKAVAGLLAGDTEPDVRTGMCDDCAYRPGSPERSSDPNVRCDAATLERLAQDGATFWCHDGLRKAAAWRHPSGLTIRAVDEHGDYQPPIVAGIPIRATGQPGLLCAGWSARRRALAAKASR